VSIGVAALIQNSKNKPLHYQTGGRKERFEFARLPNVIAARFVLFWLPDGLSCLADSLDFGAKVETTFRIALKGGLTLFARSGQALSVESLHFDGNKHYQRRVDLSRIVGRIGTLPSGVVISPTVWLDDRTSDHRVAEAQPYDDCQLLQLADILVSGFRTTIGTATSEIHRQVCGPLRELADKWNDGYPRMRHSRWFNGFSLSAGTIKDGAWIFPRIGHHAAFSFRLFEDDARG
jgi:hypothetical protein